MKKKPCASKRSQYKLKSPPRHTKHKQQQPRRKDKHTDRKTAVFAPRQHTFHVYIHVLRIYQAHRVDIIVKYSKSPGVNSARLSRPPASASNLRRTRASDAETREREREGEQIPRAREANIYYGAGWLSGCSS